MRYNLNIPFNRLIGAPMLALLFLSACTQRMEARTRRAAPIPKATARNSSDW